ncbi:hypothetical protein F5Y16DRAFT_405839 [Xylariaceae sp. FL0255]|nr:hypothetical protein F5Y16DRAFT_405839 [Xylariaceae sp. FL0255]
MTTHQARLSTDSLASQPFLYSSNATLHDNENISTSQNSALNDDATTIHNIPDDSTHHPPRSDQAAFLHRLYLRLQRQSWVSEILVWLLSMLLFAVIVLVLSCFDSKPFSEWQAPISLNALLSALVTLLFIFVSSVINMCLSQLKWNHFAHAHPISDLVLFDKNAVSVLGSLWILFKRPGNILAALAAILTILITVIGPFVQQIVCLSYVTQTVGNGTLPITTLPLGVAWDSAPDLQSLVGRALVSGANTSFNVAPSCPTNANCTWAPYDTLMAKDECMNITEYLQFDSNCVFVLGVENQIHCAVPANCSTNSNGNVTGCYFDPVRINHYIPGGPAYNQTLNIDQSTWRPFFTRNSTNATYYTITTLSVPISSLAFRDKGNVILDFGLIQITAPTLLEGPAIRTLNGTEPPTLPPNASNTTVSVSYNFSYSAFAMECSVRLVGQKMNATYINNIFEETAIGEPVENNTAFAQGAMLAPSAGFAKRAIGHQFEKDAAIAHNTSTQSNTVRISTRDPQWYWGSYSCVSFDNKTTTDIPYPLLACVEADEQSTMLSLLINGLSTTFEDHADYYELIADVGSSPNLDAIYYATIAAMSNLGRIISQFLRESQNIGALDAFIRNNTDLSLVSSVVATFGSAQPPSVAYGNATVEVLTFEIMWGWISLPATLLVLLGLLILFTEMDTQRRGMPAWGRSDLANVLHGADESTRRLLIDADEREQLDEVAGRTHVQLSRERGVLVVVLDQFNGINTEREETTNEGDDGQLKVPVTSGIAEQRTPET